MDKKQYTLYKYSQDYDTIRSIASFDSRWDAQAVAFACHLNSLEQGRRERWFILDPEGEEVPF